MWRIEEECLVINFDAFEKYYETLIKKVIDEEESMESRLHAADILITMNG
jgi:CDP-glycerol glycerophosphotransferase (TagB/SpsB family)